MVLSQVSPVVNRGVISNWLEDLPAAVEMLTVDTDGNVSHQSIPVASFAALTGAPGDNAALASALDGKAPVSHTHEIANVTGLQTALDAKLNLSGGTLTGKVRTITGDYFTPAIEIGSSVGVYDTSGLVIAYGGQECLQLNQSELSLHSSIVIGWTGTTAATGVVDAAIVRNGSGQLDVRGNSGLRVRNFANSGWATFQAGAVTANSDLSCLATVKTNVVNSYDQGKVFFGYYPAARGMSLDDSGYYFKHIDTGRFEWSSTSNNNSASDLQITRNAAGQLDVRGDSGLRVRNYANSAWGAIQCGALTSNTLSTFNSGVSVAGNVQPADSATGLRFADAFSGDRMRLISRFATISGGFDQLRLEPSVSLAFCSNVTTNSADASLFRSAAGEITIFGNSGVKLRNWAGTAFTPFQCSSITASALVTVGTYTVATLPSAAANAGALAQVTDSSVTANGSAVAGGGSNRVVVFSNGSTWDVVVA